MRDSTRKHRMYFFMNGFIHQGKKNSYFQLGEPVSRELKDIFVQVCRKLNNEQLGVAAVELRLHQLCRGALKLVTVSLAG